MLALLGGEKPWQDSFLQGDDGIQRQSTESLLIAVRRACTALQVSPDKIGGVGQQTVHDDGLAARMAALEGGVMQHAPANALFRPTVVLVPKHIDTSYGCGSRDFVHRPRRYRRRNEPFQTVVSRLVDCAFPVGFPKRLALVVDEVDGSVLLSALIVTRLGNKVQPFLAVAWIEIRHLIDHRLGVDAGFGQPGLQHLPILFSRCGFVDDRMEKAVHIPVGLVKIILLVGSHAPYPAFGHLDGRRGLDGKEEQGNHHGHYS